MFRRTTEGDNFILSFSNQLIDQLRSNYLYLEVIIEQIIELDSIEASDLLMNFIEEIQIFEDKIKILKKKAEDDDQWSDIQIK